jgi:hypothetical protein
MSIYYLGLTTHNRLAGVMAGVKFQKQATGLELLSLGSGVITLRSFQINSNLKCDFKIGLFFYLEVEMIKSYNIYPSSWG